jgi:hypothetical protein
VRGPNEGPSLGLLSRQGSAWVFSAIRQLARGRLPRSQKQSAREEELFLGVREREAVDVTVAPVSLRRRSSPMDETGRARRVPVSPASVPKENRVLQEGSTLGWADLEPPEELEVARI